MQRFGLFPVDKLQGLEELKGAAESIPPEILEVCRQREKTLNKTREL